ncbi:MAG: hypothetical protein WA874_14485 [Chryseosolibacter sp.]
MLLVTMSHGGIAQRLQVDTKQLEPLIREWNYANNFRSSESFENVYSPNLLFYTQNLERSEAIALKRSLFRKNPQFRQRINTPITYTPYSSGVIRCDFTKEVFEGSGWKQYPSYLLFSYEGNRYRIVGESDNATDKTLRYRLNIGEPMDIGSSAGADSTANDSQLSLAVPERRPGTESEASLQPAGTDQPQSVSRDSITIPKIYVFIFLGILAAAGILLFIRRRPRKPIPTEDYPMVPQNKAVEADDAYNVIREFNMQSVFEAFVITLFDPLYFRHKRPKAERVLAGKRSEGETLPDLEFEFNHRDTHVRLAIKCLYYKNAGTNEFQLFSSERQEAFRHFEDESGMPMYYIVGIGGTPDDPKEIYLVPAKAVAKEFVTRMELKPFGKSGMFFYSGTEGRLR